jgi:hypothetical protein
MGAMPRERPIRVAERAVRPVERLGIAVERRIRAIDEQ